MGGRSRKPAGADGRGGPPAVLAAYDLAKALHEAVLRFPKAERPGLGADIERACRTVLGGLIEAQMGQEKAASLRAAAVGEAAVPRQDGLRLPPRERRAVRGALRADR